MRRAIVSILPIGLSLLLLLGGLTVPTSDGTGAVASAAEKEKRKKSRRVPTMSELTYKRLAKAQEGIDEKDLDTAIEVLNEMIKRSKSYNGNELGQIHNMFAYVYFTKEDYAKAIYHYEQVIGQGDQIPEGLEVTTLYSLAQLNFIEEQYTKALDYMEIWLSKADNPGPQPHIFMGQVYYQMKDYGSAIGQIEKGITLAQDRGLDVKENWWQLLRYLYFEQENWDKVLEILEIMVRDFPKREYWIQLAGVYGQEDRPKQQMYAMEAAHVGGFLTKQSDVLSYGSLLMQDEVPYRAAKWLEQGFDEELIEVSAKNLRQLGQAWQIAQEVDKAIPVFERAGRMSDDGDILDRLSALYLEKDDFEKCQDAAERALDKGGIKKPFNTQIVLGMCQFNRDRLTGARATFVDARNGARDAENKSAERISSQWIRYIDSEKERRALLEASF